MSKELFTAWNAQIKSVSFQSDADNADAKRHYFECIACNTKTANDQNYIFMPESVPSVVAGYQKKKPVCVNHDTWGIAGLGFGATTDARYEDPNIIVTGYISLGKTTPKGPFGTTDELAQAVVDGFVKHISVHGSVNEGECSICGRDYMASFTDGLGDFKDDGETCPHIRGYKYPVKQENGDEVLKVCQVLIRDFDPNELSFVWAGSDDTAVVINARLSMAASTGLPYDINKRDALVASRTREPKKHFGGYTMSVDVLTAEKNALQAQLDAQKTEVESLKASKTALETENADLKAQAVENAQAIADGKVAREKAIKENGEAFTRANPDLNEADLTAELQGQKEFAETLTLEKLYANTAGYERQAEKLYKAGRVTQGGATDDDADPDKQGPRPRR